MPEQQTFNIAFQPIGRRTAIPADKTILEAAQYAGVELASLCGGAGVCGSCKVRIVSGHVTPPTPDEKSALTSAELQVGFRLACQANPVSDLTLEIPPESLTTPQRLQLEGQTTDISVQPPVHALDLQVQPPNIQDLRADATRLLQTAEAQSGHPYRISERLLPDLSPALRSLGWNLRLGIRRDEIIALLPTGSLLLGLAIDIGTTKLAAYLLDLRTGETLAKTGAMNPQIAYGEDVISRIAYANTHSDGRWTLQRRLIEAINNLAAEMCAQIGASAMQIVEIVAVGNTAMHHLFAGLAVEQLGTAPYVASVSEPLEVGAEPLGLKAAPGARVYLPPNVAGYVGADHVAMVLATGIWETGKTSIALDIGTNTEISLAHRGRLICCSCASGPAFEGAHISAGMRAAPGAIERVQINSDSVQYQTIGGQAPTGICGSGILDVVAEMYKAGILDTRGTLRPGHPNVRGTGGSLELVLANAQDSGLGRDVTVSRHDVNEIQLAKAAIRAGVEILLKEANITAEAIEDFIVAGAFGTYIHIPSAIRLGMFPSLPVERFRQVGNAAGAGARQMLVSLQQREIAAQIGQRLEYIELAAHPAFMEIYTQALLLKG
jgi:uncharacterized 2Fe-2S/4Fe-4S cluster protein (DUF4445 family)